MAAAKPDSEHVHETYLLARKLYEKENFPEAERLLEKLSTEAPFFADVFNKLGVIYHQRGAFGRASKAFEKALELNPHYTEAALNLAVTYNNLGHYEKASTAFQNAARFTQSGTGALDPFIRGKLANQHADLGDIYFDLGLLAEAVEEFRKAVHLGPKFADLRTKLAVALREKGDFDAALVEFQEALKVNCQIRAGLPAPRRYLLHARPHRPRGAGVEDRPQGEPQRQVRPGLPRVHQRAAEEVAPWPRTVCHCGFGEEYFTLEGNRSLCTVCGGEVAGQSVGIFDLPEPEPESAVGAGHAGSRHRRPAVLQDCASATSSSRRTTRSSRPETASRRCAPWPPGSGLQRRTLPSGWPWRSST